MASDAVGSESEAGVWAHAARIAQAQGGLLTRTEEAAVRAAELRQQWRIGAGAGDLRAACLLAESYLSGGSLPGVPESGKLPRDAALAASWFRRAADAGDAEGAFRLGVMLVQGIGAERADAAEGKRWLVKAGELGHRDAQYALGEMHAAGADGVEADVGEAFRWFRRAAEDGDVDALCAVGDSYSSGAGVAEDVEEAMRWYRRAAEGGLARAQNNMGFAYQKGFGVPQDDAEAVRWFRRAAQQGDPRAQHNLGWMHYEGHGVVQDSFEGIRWLRSAAEAGYPAAQVCLGDIYKVGHDVDRDTLEASRWYRQAAMQGLPEGMFALGVVYVTGEGAPRDLDNAEKWLRRAADAGCAPAAESLAELEAARARACVADGPGGEADGGMDAFRSSWKEFSMRDGTPSSSPRTTPRASPASSPVGSPGRGALPPPVDHAPPGGPEERCAYCGKRGGPSGAKLKMCIGCRTARYCGRSCQEAHWARPGGHAAACGELARVLAAQGGAGDEGTPGLQHLHPAQVAGLGALVRPAPLSGQPPSAGKKPRRHLAIPPAP